MAASAEQRILYVLGVAAEWESVAPAQKDAAAQGAMSSLVEFARGGAWERLRALANSVATRVCNPLRSLAWQPTPLRQHHASQLCWLVAVSPLGCHVAVLRAATATPWDSTPPHADKFEAPLLELWMMPIHEEEHVRDDAMRGKLVATCCLGPDPEPTARRLAWHPDGDLLTVVSSSGDMRVFSVAAACLDYARSGRVAQGVPAVCNVGTLLPAGVGGPGAIRGIAMRNARIASEDGTSGMRRVPELVALFYDGIVRRLVLLPTAKTSGRRTTMQLEAREVASLVVNGWHGSTTALALFATSSEMQEERQDTGKALMAVAGDTHRPSAAEKKSSRVSCVTIWRLGPPQALRVSSDGLVDRTHMQDRRVAEAICGTGQNRGIAAPQSEAGLIVEGAAFELLHILSFPGFPHPGLRETGNAIHSLEFSPSGAFLSALDIGGTLAVWSTDRGVLRQFHSSLDTAVPATLSVTAGSGVGAAAAGDKAAPLVLKDEDERIASCRWWSDDVVVLATQGGEVTVSGLRANGEMDKTKSMSSPSSSSTSLPNLLGASAEKFDACVGITTAAFASGRCFILDVEDIVFDPVHAGSEPSSPSRGKASSKRSLASKTGTGRGAGADKDQAQVRIRRSWTLRALCRASPASIFAQQLADKEYGAALALAKAYIGSTDAAAAGIDVMVVYKHQWNDLKEILARPGTRIELDTKLLRDRLGKVHDLAWLLQECCVEYVPSSHAAAAALLAFGEARTTAALQRLLAVRDEGECEGSSSSSCCGVVVTLDEAELRAYLRTLRRYRARLGALKEVRRAEGECSFDPEAFRRFRTTKLLAIGAAMARAHRFSALAVLLEQYSAVLLPHRLELLRQAGGTVDPSNYAFLLPAFPIASAACDRAPLQQLATPTKKSKSDVLLGYMWMQDAEEGPEFLIEQDAEEAGAAADKDKEEGPQPAFKYEDAESIGDLTCFGAKPLLAKSYPEAVIRTVEIRASTSACRAVTDRRKGVAEWILARAIEMDATDGQLENARRFLACAAERLGDADVRIVGAADDEANDVGADEVAAVRRVDALGVTLQALSNMIYAETYDGGHDEGSMDEDKTTEQPSSTSTSMHWLTLSVWNKMTRAEKVAAMLAGATSKNAAMLVADRILPLTLQQNAVDDKVDSKSAGDTATEPAWSSVVAAELVNIAEGRQGSFSAVAAVLHASNPTLQLAERVIPNHKEFLSCALQCVYAVRTHYPGLWADVDRIYESLPTRRVDETDEEVADLQRQVDAMENHLTAGEILAKHGAAFCRTPAWFLTCHTPGASGAPGMGTASSLLSSSSSSGNGEGTSHGEDLVRRLCARAVNVEPAWESKQWRQLLIDLHELRRTAMPWLPTEFVIATAAESLLQAGEYDLAHDVLSGQAAPALLGRVDAGEEDDDKADGSGPRARRRHAAVMPLPAEETVTLVLDAVQSHFNSSPDNDPSREELVEARKCLSVARFLSRHDTGDIGRAYSAVAAEQRLLRATGLLFTEFGICRPPLQIRLAQPRLKVLRWILQVHAPPAIANSNETSFASSTSVFRPVAALVPSVGVDMREATRNPSAYQAVAGAGRFSSGDEEKAADAAMEAHLTPRGTALIRSLLLLAPLLGLRSPAAKAATRLCLARAALGARNCAAAAVLLMPLLGLSRRDLLSSHAAQKGQNRQANMTKMLAGSPEQGLDPAIVQTEISQLCAEVAMSQLALEQSAQAGGSGVVATSSAPCSWAWSTCCLGTQRWRDWGLRARLASCAMALAAEPTRKSGEVALLGSKYLRDEERLLWCWQRLAVLAQVAPLCSDAAASLSAREQQMEEHRCQKRSQAAETTDTAVWALDRLGAGVSKVISAVDRVAGAGASAAGASSEDTKNPLTARVLSLASCFESDCAPVEAQEPKVKRLSADDTPGHMLLRLSSDLVPLLEDPSLSPSGLKLAATRINRGRSPPPPPPDSVSKRIQAVLLQWSQLQDTMARGSEGVEETETSLAVAAANARETKDEVSTRALNLTLQLSVTFARDASSATTGQSQRAGMDSTEWAATQEFSMVCDEAVASALTVAALGMQKQRQDEKEADEGRGAKDRILEERVEDEEVENMASPKTAQECHNVLDLLAFRAREGMVASKPSAAFLTPSGTDDILHSGFRVFALEALSLANFFAGLNESAKIEKSNTKDKVTKTRTWLYAMSTSRLVHVFDAFVTAHTRAHARSMREGGEKAVQRSYASGFPSALATALERRACIRRVIESEEVRKQLIAEIGGLAASSVLLKSGAASSINLTSTNNVGAEELEAVVSVSIETFSAERYSVDGTYRCMVLRRLALSTHEPTLRTALRLGAKQQQQQKRQQQVGRSGSQHCRTSPWQLMLFRLRCLVLSPVIASSSSSSRKLKMEWLQSARALLEQGDGTSLLLRRPLALAKALVLTAHDAHGQSRAHSGSVDSSIFASVDGRHHAALALLCEILIQAEVSIRKQLQGAGNAMRKLGKARADLEAAAEELGLSRTILEAQHTALMSLVKISSSVDLDYKLLMGFAPEIRSIVCFRALPEQLHARFRAQANVEADASSSMLARLRVQWQLQRNAMPTLLAAALREYSSRRDTSSSSSSCVRCLAALAPLVPVCVGVSADASLNQLNWCRVTDASEGKSDAKGTSNIATDVMASISELDCRMLAADVFGSFAAAIWSGATREDGVIVHVRGTEPDLLRRYETCAGIMANMAAVPRTLLSFVRLVVSSTGVVVDQSLGDAAQCLSVPDAAAPAPLSLRRRAIRDAQRALELAQRSRKTGGIEWDADLAYLTRFLDALELLRGYEEAVCGATKEEEEKEEKDFSLKARLVAFFKEHDPPRVRTVGKIVGRFEGKEAKLWRALYKRYNVASSAPTTNATKKRAPPSPWPSKTSSAAVDAENLATASISAGFAATGAVPSAVVAFLLRTVKKVTAGSKYASTGGDGSGGRSNAPPVLLVVGSVLRALQSPKHRHIKMANDAVLTSSAGMGDVCLGVLDKTAAAADEEDGDTESEIHGLIARLGRAHESGAVGASKKAWAWMEHLQGLTLGHLHRAVLNDLVARLRHVALPAAAAASPALASFEFNTVLADVSSFVMSSVAASMEEGSVRVATTSGERRSSGGRQATMNNKAGAAADLEAVERDRALLADELLPVVRITLLKLCAELEANAGNVEKGRDAGSARNFLREALLAVLHRAGMLGSSHLNALHLAVIKRLLVEHWPDASSALSSCFGEADSAFAKRIDAVFRTTQDRVVIALEDLALSCIACVPGSSLASLGTVLWQAVASAPVPSATAAKGRLEKEAAQREEKGPARLVCNSIRQFRALAEILVACADVCSADDSDKSSVAEQLRRSWSSLFVCMAHAGVRAGMCPSDSTADDWFVHLVHLCRHAHQLQQQQQPSEVNLKGNTRKFPQSTLPLFHDDVALIETLWELVAEVEATQAAKGTGRGSSSSKRAAAKTVDAAAMCALLVALDHRTYHSASAAALPPAAKDALERILLVIAEESEWHRVSSSSTVGVVAGISVRLVRLLRRCGAAAPKRGGTRRQAYWLARELMHVLLAQAEATGLVGAVSTPGLRPLFPFLLHFVLCNARCQARQGRRKVQDQQADGTSAAAVHSSSVRRFPNASSLGTAVSGLVAAGLHQHAGMLLLRYRRTHPALCTADYATAAAEEFVVKGV